MKPRIQTNQNIDARAAFWRKHEFYTSAIVLGLDIGLEGIGIYLRRGPQEVFASTVEVELPQAEALLHRRQMRAGRHCRKNRKTRLYRLKVLFAKHGLPWLSEEQLSRANPFRERFRAVTTGVASKEALSICIRHCVSHRGYDYGGTDEGTYPWGDSPRLSKATDWLATAYITIDMADRLESLLPELTGEREVETQKEKFLALVKERLQWSHDHSIEQVLADHLKGGHDNLRSRARGFNFPRQQVWEHLKKIILHPRHANLINDIGGFLATLGLKPNLEPNSKAAERAKRRAIFFYNRKTRDEMERHWAKKVKTCPFAEKLELEHQNVPCGKNGELPIRKWKLLEFAVTRRVEIELVEGKGKEKKKSSRLHTLNKASIENLLTMVEQHHAAQADNARRVRIKWDDAIDLIKKDVEAGYKEQAQPCAQTKSELNKAYYSQLRDLLMPTAANQKQHSSISTESATKLFDIATGGAAWTTTDDIVSRLKAAGYYDWRREASMDFNPYPQVELLLGRRIKRGPKRGELSSTCGGLLRRIFADHAAILGGANAPDYCVIETIGNPPRNSKQKGEREKEIRERRAKRDAHFAEHNFEDTGVVSKRRRISLWQQQQGRCPYTGDLLPPNPLDPSLEIEHLFPEGLGGLSVDENLVLTWRTVNTAKDKRTPLQASQARLLARVGGENKSFLSWDQMLKNTEDMHWSPKKREIFAWGTVAAPGEASHFASDGALKIPDFGNTTRVAQLARQLRAEVQRWMGLDKDPNEAARRIGTPSGWLTAQARKCWLEAVDYQKIRSNLIHHLLDAAILAHIPPREGMNHVAYGGIFYTEHKKVIDEKSGRTSYRLITKALDDLSPAKRLKNWLSDRGEYDTCPVFKPYRQSKVQSLGDATFWRQVSKDAARVAQRTALDITKIRDAEHLQKTLQDMGADWNSTKQKSEDKIPTRKELEKWLIAANAEGSKKGGTLPPLLKLKDGTPVKNLWKFDSKGTLAAPLGWSGKRNAAGVLQELRILSTKYDRLEIWLGFSPELAESARKKGQVDWEQAGWEYQKRLIPDARALKHLKKLMFYYGRDKRHKAPCYMQQYPERPETHETMRDLILGGKLLPFSKRVGIIRKGEVYRLGFSQAGQPVSDGQPAFWTSWYRVKSLGKQVELENLVFKKNKVKAGGTGDQTATSDANALPVGVTPKMLETAPSAARVLAHLLDLPAAAAKAKELKMASPRNSFEPERVLRKAKTTKMMKDTEQSELGI